MTLSQPIDDDVATSSVTVVTVSYRTAALVIRSLEALARERTRAGEPELRALIVDNDSGDAEELEAVVQERAWESWVTLLRSPRNGGFAYGNNLAFQHCYERDCVPDYFLLLNPDAEVRPRAISELVRFMTTHRRAGIAGSALEGRTGEPWPYTFRFPSLASEVNQALALGPISELLRQRLSVRRMGQVPERIEWLPGAAMLVRPELLEELGGMDEHYFLYFEETDFFLKAANAGWEAWYVPSSHVMHISGQSTKIGDPSEHGERFPSYWFESRRRYFQKNHGTLYAMLTDLGVAAARGVSRVKATLLRRQPRHTVRVTEDLLRHSPLWPSRRTLAPPVEYRPVSRAATSPARTVSE